MVARKLLWLGIGLAALSWIADSIIAAFMYGEGSLVEQMYAPGPTALLLRSLILFLLMTLACYAHWTVTKRKRAEDALRESEVRLRTIVSNVSVVLFALDRGGVFTLSEGRGLKALGLEPGQVVGLSVFDVYRDVPEIIENVRRALAGEAFTATVDVADLAFETLYTPIYDDAGEVSGVIGIATDITERKRAEEALRRSQEFLNKAQEVARIGSWELDIATGEVRLSEEMYRISGIEPGEFDGTLESGLRAIHPEDQPKILAALEVVSREGKSPPIEYRIVAPDGSERTVWSEGEPLFDDTGQAVRIVGIVQDITERKGAEEALRESEAKYRRIYETVQDIYYQTELNGTIVDLSPSVERFGYTREGLIGTSVLDIYENADERAAFVETLLKHGEVVDYELRLKAGDGRVIDASASARVRRGPDGTPVGIAGALRDISERKRAERALRESEGILRATIESTADGILVVDKEWRLSYANQQFLELWRFPRELIRTADVKKLLPFAAQQVEDPEALAAQAQRLFSSSETSLDTLALKDGRVFEQFTVPLIVAGEIAGRVVNIRDITERKRAEEALREQVQRDPLTGALNHAAIVEELRRLLSESDGAVPHAVAMVDVDGLKAVNDTYGHQVGDAVLLAVAGALSRDGALVGRYGGDEFISVLTDTDRAGAERYRKAVLDALASADLTDPEAGTHVRVVASIGLAIYPQEAETIDDLIRLSDSAMYASRRQRPIGQGGLTTIEPLGGDRAAEMVGQIVPLLASPSSLEDKVGLVAQRISAGTGYDAVNIDIFSQRTGPPNTRNVYAEVPHEVIEAWRGEQRPIEDDPFLQLFLRTRRGIIVADPQNDERLTETQRSVLRTAQLRSAAVVPLFWDEEMIGVLSVASKREGAFTPWDVQFLTTVATQITAIVRMATLVDELQSSSTRLAQAQTETVMLLAAAAEAHDQTTGRHLQGVRAVTEALAQELGQGEEDAAELGLAAVLHDIGKIRVPDAVLAHSGRLSDEDWGLLKHHTTWGAQFLAGRPGFELAATIALSHHERWDGSGYPDGLSGEAIPQAATIVAVADALDAITNDRPYRKRRSVPEAVREIAACSGEQFSPEVVEALRRLHKRKLLPRTSPESSRQAA